MEGYTKEFIENNPDYKKHLIELTMYFEGREIVKSYPAGSVKGRLLTKSVEGIYWTSITVVRSLIEKIK